MKTAVKKFCVFVLVVSIVSMSALVAAAAASGKVVMRIGTPTTNDIQVYDMEQFKRILEEKIGEKISVELYPAGQLGSNSQMLQGIQAGTIHALLEPTAFLGGFASVLNVVDLPYLYKDVWAASEILNSSYGDPLRDYLAARGIVTASFYPYGSRVTLISFPFKTLDDLAGKKIRVMGAKVLQDQFETWGAAGIPMDVPELYTAIQQKTIDGLESAPTFFQTGKYYEVAKYLLMEPKGAEVTIFMINKRWLDGLDEDVRTAILEAAVEVRPLTHEQSIVLQNDSMKIMTDAGVQVIETSPEVHDEMVKKALAVHDIFLKDNPDAKEIYEKLKEAAN
jgi:C4-dicarboxylate-binding protein DctP